MMMRGLNKGDQSHFSASTFHSCSSYGRSLTVTTLTPLRPAGSRYVFRSFVKLETLQNIVILIDLSLNYILRKIHERGRCCGCPI